jgi:hypothetical protein
MCDLAQDLHNRGIKLVNPFEERQARLAELEAAKKANAEEEEEEDDDFADAPEAVATPIIEKEKPSDMDELIEQVEEIAISREPIQAVSGFINTPMVSGRWDVIDYDTDEFTGYRMLRMTLHNGVQESDFEFSWNNKKTFKIRMKWPPYFLKPLMTVNLSVVQDSTGRVVPKFPRGHELYHSMIKIARKLKDDQGMIWSEGVFTFGVEMDGEFEVEIFETEVDSERNHGCILQIIFKEAAEEDSKKPYNTPVKKNKRAGGISFSKSSQRSAQAQAAAPAAAAQATAAAQARTPQRGRAPTRTDQQRTRSRSKNNKRQRN